MNLFNENNVFIFTSSLYEICVRQKIDLIKALEIIEKSNSHKIVSQTAKFILEELKNGNMFSNALLKNKYINFDSSYVCFIRLAERTGTLGQSISYLVKKCERKEKRFWNLIEASIYPLFVLCLCILGIISVQFLSKRVYDTNLFLGENFIFKIVSICSVVILLCFFLYVFFKNCLGENKLYEAFLAIGFLVKSGVAVSVAVGYGSYIVGIDSKLGQIFRTAQEKLEYGMDLVSAFGARSGTCVFSKNVEEAFCYAQLTGSKSDVFEKLALWMERSDERKRKLCFSLLEPVFIAATGLIMILLMVNFLFPLMSSFESAL